MAKRQPQSQQPHPIHGLNRKPRKSRSNAKDAGRNTHSMFSLLRRTLRSSVNIVIPKPLGDEVPDWLAIALTIEKVLGENGKYKFIEVEPNVFDLQKGVACSDLQLLQFTLAGTLFSEN